MFWGSFTLFPSLCLLLKSYSLLCWSSSILVCNRRHWTSSWKTHLHYIPIQLTMTISLTKEQESMVYLSLKIQAKHLLFYEVPQVMCLRTQTIFQDPLFINMKALLNGMVKLINKCVHYFILNHNAKIAIYLSLQIHHQTQGSNLTEKKITIQECPSH